MTRFQHLKPKKVLPLFPLHNIEGSMNSIYSPPSWNFICMFFCKLKLIKRFLYFCGDQMIQWQTTKPNWIVRVLVFINKSFYALFNHPVTKRKFLHVNFSFNKHKRATQERHNPDANRTTLSTSK